MIELFRDTFCWLPLAHVLDKRVMVVHGGLFSKDGVKLSDIRSIDRHRCALLTQMHLLPFMYKTVCTSAFVQFSSLTVLLDYHNPCI